MVSECGLVLFDALLQRPGIYAFQEAEFLKMQLGGYQTQFLFHLTTATGESVRFIAYLI